MQQHVSYGVIVTAEQIPLLRDVIVSHHLSVYISDTQNTQLLDDQWKPWVRRIRPQRAHCPADVWLLAPSYSWPDQQHHPRIRQIIAEQLQTCIQIAIMLNATGIVLPIEQASPVFYTRIAYYLTLIHEQLTPHALSLMLAVEPTAALQDVNELIIQMDITCPLLVTSSPNIVANEDMKSMHVFHAEITPHSIQTDDVLPAWAQQYVIGADESISLIRQKLTWLLAQPQPNSTTDAINDEMTNPVETESPPESSSLISENDKIA